MDTFDARRPAIASPKPQQTLRAMPFYGSYIAGEVNHFLADLCEKFPSAEIISVTPAGPENNILIIYRVPYVPSATA